MNQNELAHFGVVGMKWGRRRAEKAAEKAGRYRATAKYNTAESKRVASGFHNRANDLEKGASDQARSGAVFRSAATKSAAKINRERALEVENEGASNTKYFNRVSEKKAMKARKLAEKYGDAETKKKVESLIKSNAHKPYKEFVEYDETDAVVAKVKDAWETAKRQAEYTAAKERLNNN